MPLTAAARLALLSLLAAPLALRAQSTGGGAHRVSVGAGLAGSMERDESASPLAFHGAGLGLDGGYAHESERARSDLRGAWAHYGMSSSRTSGVGSSARIDWGSMQLGHLRRVARWRDGKWLLFAGGELSGMVASRTAVLDVGETREYLSWTMSAGPAAQLELEPRRGRTVTYRIGLPLVSGVVHPYTDGRPLADGAGARWSWGGPGTFRELRQTLSVTVALSAHTAFRTTALVDLLAARQAPALVGARNTLTAGIVIWSRR